MTPKRWFGARADNKLSWVVFVHIVVVDLSDIVEYIYFLIKDHIIACMSQQNMPSYFLSTNDPKMLDWC